MSLGFTAGGIAAGLLLAPSSQPTMQVADYKFLSTGSAAAAYQAFAYGAFTPAGGIFAGLTSMAMMGLYPLFAVVLSVLVAVVVVIIVAKMFG